METPTPPSSKEPRIVVFRYFDVELPSQIFDRDRDREPGRSLQDQRDEASGDPAPFPSKSNRDRAI